MKGESSAFSNGSRERKVCGPNHMDQRGSVAVISDALATLSKCHRGTLDNQQSLKGFGHIIGASAALLDVLDQVRTVARTDVTVLIGGETGTGKELIAKALHDHSQRRDHPFIRLNCAAIPTDLLESELFGHERGAFTGAVARKLGRFEAANHGTLFLDEIGDMKLELQAKLLRVLQGGEFERLGSARTQRVNLRLVVATNANLWKLVSEKRFRSDLYYRLNVFPINMPPLRDRIEDIPLLVRHFVAKFAIQMQKNITEIPTEVIQAMMRYPWPGNIRELQNFMECSVIMTTGETLCIALNRLAEINPREAITLEAARRTTSAKRNKRPRV